MTFIVSAMAAFGAEAATAAAIGLGAAEGGAAAGAAGTLGTVLGGAVGGAATGAGLGAVTGLATGQGAGKGAEMGAITGAVGGAAAPAVSAAGNAAGAAGTMANTAARVGTGALIGGAGSALGAAATGQNVGKAAMFGGLTGGALAGVNAPEGAAPNARPNPEAITMGNNAPQAQSLGNQVAGKYGMTMADVPSPGNPTGMAAPTQGPLSGLGINASTNQIMGNLGVLGTSGATQYQAAQQDAANRITQAGSNQAAAINAQSNALYPGLSPGQIPSGPIGGLATIGSGNLGYAHGGSMHKDYPVQLKDSAYIIPADVVSALGNGSSKAGAEFLRRFMAEIRNTASQRQGLGAMRHGA